MSAYEELVERCMSAVTDRNNYSRESAVCAALAEVMRALEDTTPEMGAVAGRWGFDEREFFRRFIGEILRASPLAPPKDGSP
jgi:hypothetical protein